MTVYIFFLSKLKMGHSRLMVRFPTIAFEEGVKMAFKHKQDYANRNGCYIDFVTKICISFNNLKTYLPDSHTTISTRNHPRLPFSQLCWQQMAEFSYLHPQVYDRHLHCWFPRLGTWVSAINKIEVMVCLIWNFSTWHVPYHISSN